ncbi:hypothetical protein HU200_067831 [Digitaria exilis]|uniref:Uncharacterized protein n=1 Tax=Digitaria exilis TaxID=1010633 RepID=A0A835A4G4_9POAL|nr:hypothetical protein HU200_067831 [Digitaria exilis]
MTSNSSQNLSSCSTGGSEAAVGGGAAWLGFSLSPHMAATMEDASNAVQMQQHQHQHHGGLFYPPVVTSSPAGFCYALGGGHDGVANGGGGGFYPGLSAMPLKSDGSLCIMEALHRSDQEHHGVVVSSSASPKLEDFLGAGPTMALSLDNSSFYYSAGHGHHGHGHDQAAYFHPLHDVYGGHAQLVDEQSAAAMAASWFAARGGGYDVNGAGAIVPAVQSHTPHPLALSMSSGTGSQSSSVTMQVGGAHPNSDAVTEYIAMDGGKKRGGAGQKQPTVHRKSIDTFGQRTSQYRGVTSSAQITGGAGSEGDAVVSAAAAALVQAGNCAADTWRIQAAAAAAMPGVARVDGQEQHQELLPSEAFSLLHDIVSVDAGHGGGGASAPMSNASSLAPSVSNSREQSPDRGSGAGGSLAMLFAKPVATAASKLACPLPLGSWVSPSPVSARPGVSIAHLPMFTAWTDA